MSVSSKGKEVTELVKGFSSDEKNCSMEFNEFLKMMATEERKDSQPKGDALLEAFRCFFKEIHAIFLWVDVFIL